MKSVKMSVLESILIFLLFVSTTKVGQAQPSPDNFNQVSEIYEGFNISVKSKATIRKINSFNRVLDLLMKFADFEPLEISIGHYGTPNDKHGMPVNYFSRIPFDYHRFDVKEFSKGSYNLPIDITWIILVNDLDDFVSKVSEFSKLWKSAKRFSIFSLGNAGISYDRIKTLLRFLWNRHGISKALVSSMYENFRYVYRYLPFEKFDGEFGKVQRLHLEEKYCEDEESNIDRTGSKVTDDNCPWYDGKLVSDRALIFENFHHLNAYPIHVTIFRSLLMNISKNEKNETVYSKLDANVMKLVEKHLGAKFIIKVLPTNRSVDPFETGIHNFESDDKSEILFTGYFQKCYLGEYRFTISILEDKLCMVAPSSGPLPKYLMPLLPFTNDLWFLLAIYNFIVALLWFLLKRFESKFRHEIHGANDVTTIELSINAITTPIKRDNNRLWGFENDRLSINKKTYGKDESSNEKLDRIFNKPPEIHHGFTCLFDVSILACSPLQGGKTIAEKAFLVGTLFFGLVITGLYQSSLVSSLSKPMYYPQLRTLWDVANSNRTIVTKYANIIRDLPGDESQEIKIIRSKVEILSPDERTFDMVAYRGMISLSRSSSVRLENLSKYRDPETLRLSLHLVEECPATYFLSYVVKPGSPYLERIDHLLHRMQQSGLIKKWYDEMLRAVRIARNQMKLKKNDKRSKLTLRHFSLSFLGLGIGLLLSTLVFFGELYYASRFRYSRTASLDVSRKRR